MTRLIVRMSGIGLLSVAASIRGGAAVAEDPRPSPPATAPAPAMPADLARTVREVTDVVLDNHIDPPTRQEMILSGIKLLYRAAGVPAPSGLGRRASAVAAPEQIPSLLEEVWPRATARPIPARKLEEALLEGLLGPVPGGADLMTTKEHNAAEQSAANRYVGILVALGTDDKEKRPVFMNVLEGGPAGRAGIKKGDLLEEAEGLDTRGVPLRDIVERLRGDEATDVTVKVRSPKEAKARTLKITRGRLPSDRLLQPTVQGFYRQGPGGPWAFRLDGTAPVGYVKITGIGVSTAQELRRMARQMENEGARAVVIDLRGAGAGGTALEVHAAVLVADSLLDRGAIGRLRTSRGETTYQADPDALFRGWPIAVLIDHNTSGTAEWIAAALQDNHRATIVGSPSRGAHRATGGFGVPSMEEGPGPYEAAVKSAVAVGDGRWWVSMLTGLLERGDGRPLVNRDAPWPPEPTSREATRGGVRPDRSIPAVGPGARGFRNPLRQERRLDQDDAASGQPAATRNFPLDPVLDAALEVLREAPEVR